MIPSSIEIWLGDLPMASDDPVYTTAMFYRLGQVFLSIEWIWTMIVNLKILLDPIQREFTDQLPRTSTASS
jgi:hypothetical protein